MPIRLTEEEKQKLIADERRRRSIARKQQVRAQSDAFARYVRDEITERSQNKALSIRSEITKEVERRVFEELRRSPRIAAKTRSPAVNHHIPPRRSSGRVGDNIPLCRPQVIHKRRSRPYQPITPVVKRGHRITIRDAEDAVQRGLSAQDRLAQEKRAKELEAQQRLLRIKQAKDVANRVMREGALVLPDNN